MHQSVLDSGINLSSIARISTPYIPPWSLKPASFDFSLHLLVNKSEVTPNVYQSTFNEPVSQYDGYTRIFTDGSQIGEAVGAAAIVGSQVSKKRLPNGSSIFSAEARGLLVALDMVISPPTVSSFSFQTPFHVYIASKTEICLTRSLLTLCVECMSYYHVVLK